MNLVANAVMLHNVIDLTDVLNEMAAEGYEITPELIARLSPYPTDHIRRFGQYFLDMDTQPQSLILKPLALSNDHPLK